MNSLGFTVVLLSLVGTWAHIDLPECDSPEAEEAALIAQDFLNAQHAHGYKFVLNQIEDVKVITFFGRTLEFVDIELLETECHVLDPTPLANCTVRPKKSTAVEADCDFVLKKVDGVLSARAFRCKIEELTEIGCADCPTLIPLNDPAGLDFIQASLATINNATKNITVNLLEVGRLSTLDKAGKQIYLAEFVVTEADCTDGACVPSNDTSATRGICTSKGVIADHTVACRRFPVVKPREDVNGTSTVDQADLPHVQPDGSRFHIPKKLHDPSNESEGLFSEESAESTEEQDAQPATDDAQPATDDAQPATDDAQPATDDAPAANDTTAAEPSQAADAEPAAADPAPADPAPAAAEPAPPAADPAPADDTVGSDAPWSRELHHINFKRELPDLRPSCPGKVKFF